MKGSVLLILLAVFCCFHGAACAAQSEKDMETAAVKIRIVFEGREMIVGMYDNPAGRDFLSLLPLRAQFRDFAATEKIADLPRRLATAGSPTGREVSGDFAYYAPWGNLAVFYKGSGTGDQLYVLGKIESGKELLARMSGPFTTQIERIVE